MKKISKHKKSLLAAAILCSITGSAFALPTGGVVTSGNVTNVADPSKVMTAGAHSIINWNTFDIAKNEKVTFDTKSFMVLNNVNGGQESKILGMLVDQGKGRLLLVNPSGIVIGKDAVINANNITLSTLKISNDQFQKLINGQMATFENDDLSKGVNVEKNAKITLKEALSLYGGKITIADGVEIISKDYGTANVDILARNQVITNTKGNVTTVYDPNLGDSNVSIGNVTMGTTDKPVAHLDIRGDNVDLNGVKSVADNKNGTGNSFTMLSGHNINVKNSSFENKNGEMFVVAPQGWSTNQDVSFFELETELKNNINIDNSNFFTAKNDMTILGGNVDIKKSNIDSGNNLIVGAVKSYGNAEGVRSATTYDTSTVTIDEPTTIKAKGSSIVYGAILNVNPNKFKHTIPSDSPLIEILDRNDLTVDEIIELVQKHNPDITADEIRSAFNSMYIVPKPIIPDVDNKPNDADALKALLDSLITKNNAIENDSEWQLVQDGVVPRDYDGIVKVVMDTNNPEKSEMYIEKSYYEKNRDKDDAKSLDKIDDNFNNHLSPKDNLEAIINNYEHQEDNLYDKIYELLSEAKENHKKKIEAAIDESYLKMKDKIDLSNTTVKKNDIPDEVYQAFLKPVTDKMKESALESFDPNTQELPFYQKIFKAIGSGLQSIDDPKPVKVDKTTYKIKFDNSWTFAGANSIIATVQWAEGKEKKTATLTLPKLNDDKVIANYTKALTKLAEDVTENALVELYTYGLQDVTTKGKIVETKDFAKNLCAALVDNKNANNLIDNLGEKAGSYIKSKWGFDSKGKLGSFLNDNLGKDFTSLVKKLGDLNNEKNKYVDAINKAKSDDEIDRISAGYWLAEKTFTNALNAIK